MPSAARVTEIFRDCLFREDELVEGQPTGSYLLVEGLTQKFGFQPDRTRGYTEEIGQLLRDLPQPFSTGGWSFLNGCLDRSDQQWGEQFHVEQLLVLGLATEQAGYCLPREVWSSLPGGVPYFWVKPKEG